MTSMNRVYLMGNLTRDPSLRRTSTGDAVADLGLAMTETFQNKSGESVKNTCFVDVVVWKRQAETCGEFLAKGAAVMVEGRLQLDQWKGKDGETRNKLRVRADRVHFLGRPQKTNGQPDEPEEAAPAAPVTPSRTPPTNTRARG